MAYPDHVMRQTAYWASFFARDWKSDFPIRIHSSAVAEDGAPQWHPDFEKWLTTDRPKRLRHPDPRQRLRTTRVMRRLRRTAVREYEVLYRVLVLNEPLEETTRWLNQRAERNGVPYPAHRPDGPHYVHKDTLALVIAGIDFARECW